jgi:nucleoside phosphorylase
LGDIDFTPLGGNTRYGQIKEMPAFYSSEEDYIKLIETINSRTENLHIGRGPLISTNIFFKNRKKANELLNNNFAHIESTTAFDTEAGGVITACYVHEVPWLLLKAVNYQIGKDEQLLSSLRIGIEAQPYIGNLIETLLEELVHSFDN